MAISCCIAMKLLKFGVVLMLVVVAAIAALGSINYMDDKDNSNDKLLFESMFKEEKCLEDAKDVICTETLYMRNDDGNKIPLMTGHTIKEKIFVPKYVEKEKIIVEEKKLMGEERESPQDRIKDADVNVYGSRVIINIENAKSRKFIDSNSMDPLIDEGTTTIEAKPKNAAEIKVGDIIAYDVKGYDYAFVHRVVGIGNDEKGVYFITKGDNYWKEDPDKVRFSQIEGIIVGILY